MDLDPHIAGLRDQLLLAAEAGGEEVRPVAERLTATLQSAFRLALLDALSVATAEITRELAPGSVELRLRGRDPEFVVVGPPAPEVADSAEPTVPARDDDSPMTRINLRLGQDLKDRVEEAARWEGLSVNAWLVRAAGSSLASGTTGPSTSRGSTRGAGRYRGWVR